jgi:hypothetical protein
VSWRREALADHLHHQEEVADHLHHREAVADHLHRGASEEHLQVEPLADPCHQAAAAVGQRTPQRTRLRTRGQQ